MANGDIRHNKPSIPPLRVIVERGKAERTDFNFTEAFRIGRDKSSQVRLLEGIVSRSHAEVFFDSGSWWIRDLQSANGLYIAGNKIDCAQIAESVQIELGVNGPLLSLSVEKPAVQELRGQEPRDLSPHEPRDAIPPVQDSARTDIHTMDHYVEHYFSKSEDGDIGLHTFMIRRAFQDLQKKQKRKYSWIIAFIVVLLAISGGYGLYQYEQTRKVKKLAEDIFYTMKAFELKLTNLEVVVEETGDAKALEQLRAARAQHKEMEKSYDKFIEQLDIYSEGMSPEDRIIFHISRIFGECEVNIPPGFIREVKSYIGKWQSSGRLKRAIEQALRNRYHRGISEVLQQYNLPVQFFYLALQESNFDINACGPQTRYGIAKGMWQFIPSTGAQYGLRIGPLAETRMADPRDDRHQFDPSTRAAARYLRDLYKTEAQASGLLVMASYNWGQGNVRELIRRMPENPRERNFWLLLQKSEKQIPKETYDYVFYIVSAAVIGENPQLFGFDFDNPLGHGSRD